MSKLSDGAVVKSCPECKYFGIMNDFEETTFCKLNDMNVPMSKIHPSCPFRDVEVIEGSCLKKIKDTSGLYLLDLQKDLKSIPEDLKTEVEDVEQIIIVKKGR